MKFTKDSFKEFVESYRCRICKKPLTLDNFGGLGENHMIFCIDCKNSGEIFIGCTSSALHDPHDPLGTP